MPQDCMVTKVTRALTKELLCSRINEGCLRDEEKNAHTGLRQLIM